MAGYPCYVCAMSSAGVPCPSNSFITASVVCFPFTFMLFISQKTKLIFPPCQTSCITPPLSYSPQPPVVLPCSTCLPYTLSTCPAYTVPPSGSVYIVPATTVVPHIHSQAVTAPAATSTTVISSASVIAKASSTPVPFTGSAGRVRGAEAGVMALGGAIMVAALAL